MKTDHSFYKSSGVNLNLVLKNNKDEKIVNIIILNNLIFGRIFVSCSIDDLNTDPTRMQKTIPRILNPVYMK